MDVNKFTENHLTSAAAFVEGGIQDACDDACSICLEAFCDSNPSSLTSCKHEFHLQCILEWCQRSSQCPMCWQPINLKDPASQELLEAVEHEKKLRLNPPRTGTIFHHPAFGEFELQNLPIGVSDAELEERIIQHLAAAALGRSHYMARREGQRSRSSAQGRPQFLVLSTSPNVSPTSSVSSSPVQGADNGSTAANSINQSPLSSVGEEPSQGTPQLLPTDIGQNLAMSSGSGVRVSNQPRISTNNRSFAGQSSPINEDRAGPSDLQSLSESLKARFSAVSAVSMRYKESLSKSTRGWKERLFSRNTSTTDPSSEVKREVNAGIASVSHLMEHLETRENGRDTGSSASNNNSLTEPDSQRNAATRASNSLNGDNTSPACVANSSQQ